MVRREYDAVVVGSGPNGLAAAITMQQQGLSVLLIEGKKTIGGGMQTEELTLPGFHHDVCSAVHPLAVDSSFFNSLPLEKFGLEFIYSPIEAVHPFTDGSAISIYRSVEETAVALGQDKDVYLETVGSVVKEWPMIRNDVLGPLHFPKHVLPMIKFGLQGLRSAENFSKKFSSEKLKALFAGMAAHAILPLDRIGTTAFGMVLLATAHSKGWPLAKGGSKIIARALADYFVSLGGKIETSLFVKSLRELPSAHAVLFDVSPKQLLQIAGEKFSPYYQSQLQSFRYGAGVFKIDWALDAPVPFVNDAAKETATLHFGNSFAEIVESEEAPSRGRISEKPFILFSQPSLFDQSRAPEGRHTAWGYCHVPNGSQKDVTGIIEKQIERFAPGFRERILARHTMNTAQLEEYDHNYIGGDINGGSIDIRQLFTRPALRLSPYRTSAKGLYICSASTPPGGGVHGMCGFHAAKRALRDVFKINVA